MPLVIDRLIARPPGKQAFSHFAPLLLHVREAGCPDDSEDKVTSMQHRARNPPSKKISTGRASVEAKQIWVDIIITAGEASALVKSRVKSLVPFSHELS